MTLSSQDRLDIADLINLHGHVADGTMAADLSDLFTPDVVYDITQFGLGEIRGLPALRRVFEDRPGDQPVGHHVTNIVITAIDDHSARVRSKAIAIMADGSGGSADYDDVVTRQPTGWKISFRKIGARRSPKQTAARTREIFDAYRGASIDHSREALAALLTDDTVMEFPFTRPGLPSRLEGRDVIMEWISRTWGAMRTEGFETIALHDTTDPETIIVEQVTVGHSPTTEFRLPNIIVFTVRDGRIATIRDYVNVVAAMEAVGQDL